MTTKVEISEKVAQCLRDEAIIWLTTNTPKGNPQPAPVWFLWEEDAGTFLIYSLEGSLRNRNVAQHSKVALNLNSNEQGGDVVILWGEASIVTDVPPANQLPAYLEKYRNGIARIGMTPDSFAARYSTVIRIMPNRIKAF